MLVNRVGRADHVAATSLLRREAAQLLSHAMPESDRLRPRILGNREPLYPAERSSRQPADDTGGNHPVCDRSHY
jgi:hypothetical protein